MHAAAAISTPICYKGARRAVVGCRVYFVAMGGMELGEVAGGHLQAPQHRHEVGIDESKTLEASRGNRVTAPVVVRAPPPLPPLRSKVAANRRGMPRPPGTCMLTNHSRMFPIPPRQVSPRIDVTVRPRCRRHVRSAPAARIPATSAVQFHCAALRASVHPGQLCRCTGHSWPMPRSGRLPQAAWWRPHAPACPDDDLGGTRGSLRGQPTFRGLHVQLLQLPSQPLKPASRRDPLR